MRVRIAVCALTLSALLALSACSLLPSASKPAPQPAASTVASKDPHVPGADCKKCHVVEHKRWSESLHAASAQNVLANVEHDKAELLTDECITCHAPFQVSTFKIGQLVTPLDQKGPWKINTANAAKWQAIKCEVCHDPTSSVPFKLAFYDGAKRAYVPVTDATDLCSKCHVPGTDDSRDLKGSVHEGLKCTACHFGSGMKADPKLSCTDCHPAVNKKHPDVTQLDTTYKDPTNSKNNIHFVKCADCHPQGIPPVAP
jgi:Doubled CXXCH motif (Paired_CXXCH_1)